jgi:RNA polymerase sigma factor (sigma-70 family)
MITFEERIDEIDVELEARRSKWTLHATPWMDFDDVSQIIRLHIYKKWNRWDQSKPLRPWLRMVILNQIRNLLKTKYVVYAPPCVQCDANQGNDLCSLYETQCDSCPLYAKWITRRKNAFNVKLPVSLENHLQEVSSQPEMALDVNQATLFLSERLKEELTETEFRVFDLLYVQQLSEEEAAKQMKYRSGEKRGGGYKRISEIKKTIMEASRKIFKNEFFGGQNSVGMLL